MYSNIAISYLNIDICIYEKMEDSACRECGTKKKSESPTGIEPMTFRTPVRRSNHWATGRLVASIGHIYIFSRYDIYRKVMIHIGRSWVWFQSGTQIFSLSHAGDMLNIPSSHISSPSLKFTIFRYLYRWKKYRSSPMHPCIVAALP